MDVVTSGDDLQIDQVMDVTESARTYLVGLRDAEPEGSALGVRIAIVGTQGIDYQYDLEFTDVASAPLSDVVENHGGLRLVLPQRDLENLRGATLDHDGGGLVLRNPNKPKPFQPDRAVATGPLAEQVQSLLASDINPSLAAHGGFVELVGVEESEGLVYMQMGGGCQGCAMSRMTMISGVQAMLREQIPEVSRVIDVTDHTAGENPYYA